MLVILLVLIGGVATGVTLTQQNSSGQLSQGSWNKLYLLKTEHLATPIKGILDAIGTQNYNSLTNSCQQLSQDAANARTWPPLPDKLAAPYFSKLIDSFGQIAVDCDAVTARLRAQESPQTTIKKMLAEMSFASQQMKDIISII